MATKETPEQKVQGRIEYLRAAKHEGLDTLEGESKARQKHAAMRMEHLQGTHLLRARMSAEAAWQQRMSTAKRVLEASDDELTVLVKAAQLESVLVGKESTVPDTTVPDTTVPDTTTTTVPDTTTSTTVHAD